MNGDIIMKSNYRKYLTTPALAWAGCFIVFLFLYLMVLAPQKKIKAAIGEELAEKKQLHRTALRAAQKEGKIRLRKEIERLRSILAGFVIEPEEAANLTFDIGQIASQQKVGSFNIGSKGRAGILALPDCKCIGESHLEISFTGNFNQFAGFLNALERHQPVIFVDEFSITRTSQQGGHRARLSAAVFVRVRQGS